MIHGQSFSICTIYTLKYWVSRMGGAWGAQVGGSNITPPILDPLEAMILDPWDPLVMWNDDDDDGDDHIQNPSANLPCADNLSRHHLDHNFYLKKSTNSVLF